MAGPIPPEAPALFGDWRLPDHRAQRISPPDLPDWFAAVNHRLAGLELCGIEIARVSGAASPGSAPGPEAWVRFSAAFLRAVGSETPLDPIAILDWTPSEVCARVWLPQGFPDRQFPPKPSPEIRQTLAPFASWLDGLESLTLWFVPAPKSAHVLARLRHVGYQGDLP